MVGIEYCSFYFRVWFLSKLLHKHAGENFHVQYNIYTNKVWFGSIFLNEYFYCLVICVCKLIFRLRLGGRNRMEWKGIKRIILEYSSILLFGSFNGRNGKSIPLFGSLSKREHLFLSIPLKPQIFIPPKIGKNGREWN